MKKLIILLAILTIGSFTLFAQGPPPNPPATADNGGTNGYVGGTGGSSAPIGNGAFILISLAAAYAGRKIYAVKEAENKD